jgi:hypothetical protein
LYEITEKGDFAVIHRNDLAELIIFIEKIESGCMYVE